MLERRTSHHFLVESIRVYDPSDVFPDMHQTFLVFWIFPFDIVVCDVTKLDEITEFTRVFKSRVIQQRLYRIPHHMQFI